MLRVLTLNVKGGAADAEAITASVAALEVDILAVQELTAGLVRRLALSGLDDDPAAAVTSTRGRARAAPGCGPAGR